MILRAKVTFVFQIFLIALLIASTNVVSAELPGSEQQIEQRWRDVWQQLSDQESRYINRLVLSDSAYLRQHADNPIDWQIWNEATFAKARKENKLIFLSIGYASCHWCHVMEKESFLDIDVATLLNQSYISIKVDREQQPDIDAYYTLVVEIIKGESGWPITVVLLPNGKPIFATNYLSKDKLITAMQRLNTLWNQQPAASIANANILSQEVELRHKPSVNNNVLPGKTLLKEATKTLLNSIDPVYAGFGLENKFPDELKLQFLLNRYKSEQTPELRDALIKQLDAQINSGLSDIVFGGVFRYTTDREMTLPHFEKMLYNQALTVSLFADAANWLKKPEYKQYAHSIIQFVETTMQLPDGNYAAAVDADFQGHEGSYYLWQKNELTDIPPQIKQKLIGKQQVYLYGGMPENSDSVWRDKLIQSKTGTPRIIKNRITAWNALWLTALLDAGEIDTALLLAEAIWKSAWTSGQLQRMGNQPAYLDDYSYLSLAYWQLYTKTGDSNWKRRARKLDRNILTQFYQNGMLSYQAQSSKNSFPVDIYQDRELPSTAATTTQLFQYHQTEVEFVQAYEAINKLALTSISNRPEYYLSLIQSGFRNYAVADQIIAKGHAVASLVPISEPGKWHLTVKLESGWHINASEVFDKNLIPTSIQKNDLIDDVIYPRGEVLPTEFSNKPLNLYSEIVLIEINTAFDLEVLALTLELQACSNNLCLLPEKIKLRASRTNK